MRADAKNYYPFGLSKINKFMAHPFFWADLGGWAETDTPKHTSENW